MPNQPFTFKRPTATTTAISDKQYILPNCTDHQNSVMSDLLNSDARITRLTGSAGVGKSTTISAFIQYCIANKISLALTGTTHAAVAVLSNMVPENYRSHIPTSTIHSYLGMKLMKDNKGGEKLVRIPDFKPKAPVKYLICDEVSMLTTELITHLKASRVRNQIILVGDAVQLNLPNSVNLDRYPAFELTVNMRQDNSREDLRTYLSSLRELIESNSKQLPPMPANSANLTIYDDHCVFLKAYKESTYQSKVFACFMNKSVKTYNTNIKKYIEQSDDLYSIGDIVSPTSPTIINGTMTVPNRAICVVEDIMDCDEFWSLQTDKGVLDVPKVKTTFQNYLDALAAERNWKELYTAKERFTHVHHLFAGTAHSLQGTTVEEVFVDIPDLALMLGTSGINAYLRALYVSISRASKRVHLYIGTERKYKCLGSYTPRIMKD